MGCLDPCVNHWYGVTRRISFSLDSFIYLMNALQQVFSLHLVKESVLVSRMNNIPCCSNVFSRSCIPWLDLSIGVTYCRPFDFRIFFVSAKKNLSPRFDITDVDIGTDSYRSCNLAIAFSKILAVLGVPNVTKRPWIKPTFSEAVSKVVLEKPDDSFAQGKSPRTVDLIGAK
jgi:hypothetical protein